MEFPGFEEITQILVEYIVDTFVSVGLIGSIFVLILVMILQAIIAPIISEAILSAAGGFFFAAFGQPGIYAAIIGGIIGSLLGAITAFYIARWFQGQVKNHIVDGYFEDTEITGDTRIQRFKSRMRRLMSRISNFLARFIDEDSDDFIEVIEKRGFLIVLVGRILPFVPFDAISYAAGFTRINFRDYIIATSIGTVPRVIFYVLLGTGLIELLESDFNIFLIFFGLVVGLILILYKGLMTYLRRGSMSIETDQISDKTMFPELAEEENRE